MFGVVVTRAGAVQHLLAGQNCSTPHAVLLSAFLVIICAQGLEELQCFGWLTCRLLPKYFRSETLRVAWKLALPTSEALDT